MQYFKQLDSLRGIAVLMVIYSHWLEGWRIGQMGVSIFFTLSGFLITRILLQNRFDSELLLQPKIGVIRNFYIKRILRIFPIYFLTIVLFSAFSNYLQTPGRLGLVYYFTFTANIKYYLCQCFDGSLTHLWSLSVEEQFYLLWPWLILYFPRKYILPIIYGAILIGVISQLVTMKDSFSRFMTFQCFDAFGIGALISWNLLNENKVKNFSIKMLILGSVYLNICLLLNYAHFNYLYFLPDRTITALFTAAIISHVISNHGFGIKAVDFVMNHKWLVFCGKISYGIYLYHIFVPEYFNRRFLNIYVNPHIPSFFMKFEGWLFHIENLFMLAVMAILSYYFIEQPFLKLKKRFE
jgi:peptidoglycan/LPS O-acetylase OafA/YrhL